MKQYVVIYPFKDEKDNNYIYNQIGAPYPRKGLNIDDISQDRLDELASSKNKLKRPLIRNIGTPAEETTGVEEPGTPAEETTEVEEPGTPAEETTEVEEPGTPAEETTKAKETKPNTKGNSKGGKK